MSEKPVAPDQGGARSNVDEAPRRSDDEFRLLCRRYSRLRARASG